MLPKDQEHKVLLLKEMKPLLGGISFIPAPSGPIDVDRLNRVFSRIRFKMIDSSSPEWGAARPLQAQMREVRGLIDAIRTDFGAIERPKLLGRLKRFEARMFVDLNDKLSLLHENMESGPLTAKTCPDPCASASSVPTTSTCSASFPRATYGTRSFSGGSSGISRRSTPTSRATR